MRVKWVEENWPSFLRSFHYSVSLKIHINFGISLSIYAKKSPGMLIRIVLNLQTNLASIVILTSLSLLMSSIYLSFLFLHLECKFCISFVIF